MGRCLISECFPLAAFLASLSALSFPIIPLWPAVHLIVSLHPHLFLRFCIRYVIFKNSRARWCLGLLRSESKTLIAAWLSTAIEQVLAARFSVLMRCIASRSPTNSASWTVCSASGPSWKCRNRSGLFFLISIAAAPTLPSWAEPSVNTWTSSVAFSAARAELSLSSGILIWNGSLPVLVGSRARWDFLHVRRGYVIHVRELVERSTVPRGRARSLPVDRFV